MSPSQTCTQILSAVVTSNNGVEKSLTSLLATIVTQHYETIFFQYTSMYVYCHSLATDNVVKKLNHGHITIG